MQTKNLTWNNPTAADQRTFSPQSVFEAGLRHHHIANTAYPINHQTTMRAYRVPKGAVEPTAVAAWQGTDTLGLYVHIPFCKARCKYCEYTVVGRDENEDENVYFDALLREFDLYRQQLDTSRKTLIGFDIGGGTPSFVKSDNIRRVVEAARASFDFEPGMAISIETTPIIAEREPEKLHAFREMDIERISMGVQTTQFKLAQSLEREYEGLTMLERAVRNIRNAGFRRFNIDLMYGFADQSPDAWRATVEQTIGLEPEYVTLYQMRYKGTRMQDQADYVTRQSTNRLAAIARDRLLAAGYAGTPGKNTYSRVPNDVGTSDYLTERVVKGTPYLGLGLGAQSLSHHTLSYNLGAASKTLKPYLRAVDAGRLPIQDIYHLPLDAAMAKMIAVSFYFGEIHQEHFAAKFGTQLEDHFPREVDFVLHRGLMENVGSYLRLTPHGAEHFNGVVALFYSGAVQKHLIDL
ncbi:MAG: radical SAM protein [Chloroflexi bacterium]|nr:radical SAM protein [Chloroflexota bacterium]